MTILQEYDLEFKLVHIIKGHGLCQLAAEVTSSPGYNSSGWEYEIEMYNIKEDTPTFTSTSLFVDV